MGGAQLSSPTCGEGKTARAGGGDLVFACADVNNRNPTRKELNILLTHTRQLCARGKLLFDPQRAVGGPVSARGPIHRIGAKSSLQF